MTDTEGTRLVRAPASQPADTGWGRRHDLGYWPSPSRNVGLTAPLAQLWRVQWDWMQTTPCEHGLMPAHVYTQSAAAIDWADEVFSHSRSCSDGSGGGVVLIGFDPLDFMHGSVSPFRVQVIRRTSAREPLDIRASLSAYGFRFIVPPEQPLKLYAGQADLMDASHLTIQYETPAGKGVIDGWLKPDYSVKLSIRDGPAKRHSEFYAPQLIHVE